MGRHGRGATKTWPGGEFGDAEESTQSRVAVARTDGRTSAISTSLYWAPLFARLHKRGEPKTGGLVFRRKAEREGTLDEEISAIEILGSLKMAGREAEE